MANSSPGPSFTWDDLEQWAAAGMIRHDQLDAIRARLSAPSLPSEGERPAVREHRAGLNLTTVAYYFGAFMILLAGTIFLGAEWETLGRPGQLVASWCAVAGLWSAGALLRGRGYPLGGNLLIFAGTGVTPLAIYTTLRILNLWPVSADSRTYHAFYERIDAAWLILEIGSGLIALAVAYRTRFPLLTLLIGFWGWYLSMDLTELLAGHDNFQWGPPEWTVGASVGLVMIAIGLWLQRRHGGQAWSRWFYIFGHIALLGNLTALAFNGGPWLGLLFIAVYIGCVIASVWLQSRTFLVFGALGCYAYICRLAFDVFDGSLAFSVALAAIGLLLVLVTVAYQRYAHPWLASRLAPPPGL